MTRSAKWLLATLGFSLIAIYVGALEPGNLRRHTIELEWLFFSAFIIYGVARFISLQSEEVNRRAIQHFCIGSIDAGYLVFSCPTLTDDMYRYVWVGAVIGAFCFRCSLVIYIIRTSFT
jgi:hypothetical protein